MIKIKFIAVLFLAVLAGCVGKSTQSSNSAKNVSANRTNSVTMANSGGGGGGGNEPNLSVRQQISLNPVENNQTQPTPIERKIVRNAALNLEAVSAEEAQQKITTIAESKGGFVVESQQSSSDVQATTRDIVTMSVRVPAAKFSETLDEIRKQASRVIVETIKSDDVTENLLTSKRV